MPAHVEVQPQELPAFGSGIEFRPRKKARQEAKVETPAAAPINVVSGLVGGDQDVADTEQVGSNF